MLTQLRRCIIHKGCVSTVPGSC